MNTSKSENDMNQFSLERHSGGKREAKNQKIKKETKDSGGLSVHSRASH